MVNLPNIISLSRIPAIFLIASLLYATFFPAGTTIFILYVIVAFTDLLDGYIARKYNIVSNFGKLIDALTDKIFVISFFVILVASDLMPHWALFCVLLIITREFLITGLRLVAASRGTVLAAEKAGKLKTFSQIFTIGTYLFKHMAALDYGHLLLPWMMPFIDSVGISMLILTTLLTVSSGASYLTKYWNIFTSEA